MLQLFLGTCTWILVGAIAWSLGKSFSEGIAYLKKLHQIPCSRCVFFTGDYHLKCTVHPLIALSEKSLDCRDFEPKSNTLTPPAFN